jgi:hypothetical protein
MAVAACPSATALWDLAQTVDSMSKAMGRDEKVESANDPV